MATEREEFKTKVCEYLQGRKTPATPLQIKKYFLRSSSYISTALNELVREKRIVEIKAGTLKFYTVGNKL